MVAQIVESIDKQCGEWEKAYIKDQDINIKQLEKLKTKVDKERNKILKLEMGVEINKEKMIDSEEAMKDI